MSERPPISPRSPRAALEPEQVPPPPKRSERARNPFVVVGNAIITIILVLMIGAGGGFVYGKKQLGSAGAGGEDDVRQPSHPPNRAENPVHRQRAVRVRGRP